MSIFSWFRSSPPTDSSRFEALEAKVRALEDGLEQVNRRLKGFDLEWDEAYDKMKHLMARITKRAKVEQKEAEEAQDASGPPIGDLQPQTPHHVGGGVVGMHSQLQEARRRHGLLPR